MAQLEHIEAIERRLWSAADTLRANSGLASNEYFLPVMGLVFLRHAYSRYSAVKPEVQAALPSRGGRRRPAGKEDFSRRNAIFLRPEAQFEHLVTLPDAADRAAALIGAMESIERDYESLRGALPKEEYRKLDNDVLGELLRTLNPDELRRVSGDVFGRIYEYFLTRFADQKAHDNGEFFTPVSLVSFIAHVLEPDRGVVLDPASGSGGMFVQSARTVTERGGNPTERLTFRGIEKNDTTIRLARMNLAVHGLEGDIRQAITYYEDPHALLGKADYVMANPPFNVDEIDADKVRRDPRLPFGLPGVNKKDRVSNGNYVWISYFYSYLNPTGRAGFVMSSQASSASGAEAAVRRKLVETGDVDVMVAIRSNFFYIRTVPCELWFLDRAKSAERRGKVLMLDARSVYRKVTRKIYDFTPEQQQNLLAIVWLYRGEYERFLGLVAEHLERMVGAVGEAPAPVQRLVVALDKAAAGDADGIRSEDFMEFDGARETFVQDVDAFDLEAGTLCGAWDGSRRDNASLTAFADRARPLVEAARDLIRQTDHLHRLLLRVVEGRGAGRGPLKAVGEARSDAVKHLKAPSHFWRQARWLQERFPDAVLRDVEGLVKLVGHDELAANDWSLTPGRYVGVPPKEQDEDFDFEQTMHAIHSELDELNAESVRLAATIKRNFEALGL
jgi:type I restriction enzyme M protein